MFCASGLIFDVTEGVRSCFHVLCTRTCFPWYRGRRVPFLSFALLDSFSALPRASGPIFKFSAPGLIFDGTEGVRSRFHALRSRTCFLRCRVRRVPFSCFVLPDSISTLPRASAPVFMFCAPGHVFGGTEGVGSRFQVLCARTHFQRIRGCRVPFSCFALPESFPAVTRASGPVFKFRTTGFVFGGTAGIGPDFMFCPPELVFDVTEGVGSRFHVLRALIRIRRYRGRRLTFSSFALPDLFSAVPMASAPFFMFCATGLVFGGTEGAGSRFHVLRSWSRFSRYRGRRLPFSCFARPDSFSVVPWASGPVFKFCAPVLIFSGTKSLCRVFMFCAPGLIFGCTEGVASCFHVLRSWRRFPRYRGRRVPFSSFELSDSFSAIPRVSSPDFDVLRSWIRFRRFCGHQEPISRFAPPDTFSVVPRAWAPVFMFCAPRLFFHGTEGVGSHFHVFAPGLVFGLTEIIGSCFHVLRSRTHFRRYRGRRLPFSCFRAQTHFRRYRGRRVLFSFFCAPGHVLGITEGVRSRFHVLRFWTCFLRCRVNRVPFWTIPRASAPVFMFCAPRLIFGGTEGVRFRFHVLRSPTCFMRFRVHRVPF
jgi:hypothetical protein